MDRRYIWQEIQENGHEKVQFTKEIENPSLVEEVSGKDVQGNTKVNLKLRFPGLLDVTECLAGDNPDPGSDESMKGWELDLLLHFYAAVDLYSGYNANNRMLDILHKRITDSIYGSEVRTLYMDCSAKEQDIILRNLALSIYQDINVFGKAFKEMFAEGLIYKKDSTIFVYLDMDEDERTNQVIDLLKLLFLPVCQELKVHYKYHMGIIGIDATMKTGKIRII